MFAQLFREAKDFGFWYLFGNMPSRPRLWGREVLPARPGIRPVVRFLCTITDVLCILALDTATVAIPHSLAPSRAGGDMHKPAIVDRFYAEYRLFALVAFRGRYETGA